MSLCADPHQSNDAVRHLCLRTSANGAPGCRAAWVRIGLASRHYQAGRCHLASWTIRNKGEYSSSTYSVRASPTKPNTFSGPLYRERIRSGEPDGRGVTRFIPFYGEIESRWAPGRSSSPTRIMAALRIRKPTTKYRARLNAPPRLSVHRGRRMRPNLSLKRTARRRR